MSGAADGTAEAAEKFRRYPMTWSIMARVFTRIPLISLAKSLADRRFIPILQQTLNDISKPTAAFSDVETVDAGTVKHSRKRKRSAPASFDLESLRRPHGSLGAADSLFHALHTLLARLELVEADSPPNVLMGAEHIKSLFYSTAKEAAELLRPILVICDLALQEEEVEPLEDQASWISVFVSLWNLHLQSSGDAAEVATSLYIHGCFVLAKMDRSQGLTLEPHVKAAWTRDLRRFFIKNMILPARAAFLNRKDIDVIQSAVDGTNFAPTAASPVLFNLAIKAPRSTEDADARKNHEDWTQKVFDIIEKPMREADPVKRNEAMKIILDTALQVKGSVSLGSLRMVCKAYCDASGKVDLNLITRVANLDVDAFLISDEGHALLDIILQRVTGINNTGLRRLAEAQPVDLIVSLAKGFAKGRDLPGFVKKWYEALTECLSNGPDYSDITGVWSCNEVTAAVSSLLQSSVNARQLVTLLEWLESQESATKPVAHLIILDAISQGITEEEFVDASNPHIYRMISGLDLKTKPLDDASKARWWHIMESIVLRSTLEQSNLIWAKVEPDLKKVLKKGNPDDLSTLAAFNCSSRFWLANYERGSYESEAANLTCSFLGRLESKRRHKTTYNSTGTVKIFETPRLVEMLARSDLSKEYLQAVLERIGAPDVTSTQTPRIADNQASLTNFKYNNGLVAHSIDVLTQEQTGGSSFDAERVATAAQILFYIPSEAVTREHREQIMPKALFFASNLNQKKLARSGRPLEVLLALMAKITKRPTFYETMKFADLVTIGDSILSELQPSIGGEQPPTLSSTIGLLKLFEAVATNTMKQMTSTVENRERVYLAEAATTVASWPAHTTDLQPHRSILLKSLITALESSKMAQQMREVADPVALREHASVLFERELNGEDRLGTAKNGDWHEHGLSAWCALVSYDQLDVIEPSVMRNSLAASRSNLELLCEKLCSTGWRAGWRIKELLFRCFGDTVSQPLEIRASEVQSSSGALNSAPLCMRADASDVDRYLDVVLKAMGKDTRDDYFGDIAAMLRDGGDVTGHLFALNRLLHADNGTTHAANLKDWANIVLDPTLRSCLDMVDLAKVHSVLSSRLASSQSPFEFDLIARTLCTLLDKKASSMKQWNTEITLSTVAIIAAGASATAQDVQTSPNTYEWLCHLVEAIIKRHRLRLEGHFHLLVTTLQSLLRRLLVASPTALESTHAKLFARLLTLICEPSVASVTRGQQLGALDSAVDAAKRSAGSHLYLVLMSYIKLQLEHVVPGAIREALEPGVYAVLDITSHGGKRILNEAVDASGRAIFREMHKRYDKFGKWSGV